MAKAATAKKKNEVGELHFDFETETTGAVRYKQKGFDKSNADATAIGTLYIRKAHLFAPYPKSLTVKIVVD